MKFEWDDVKNDSNKQKHGIGFEDVLPLFESGNYAIEFDDENSTLDEDRWIARGAISGVGRVVVVFIEIIDGETIRIISARKGE